MQVKKTFKEKKGASKGKEIWKYYAYGNIKYIARNCSLKNKVERQHFNIVNIWYLLEEPEEDSSPWEEILIDLDNDSAWQGNNDESQKEKGELDQQNKFIN